jgi:hypothetical protein
MRKKQKLYGIPTANFEERVMTLRGWDTPTLWSYLDVKAS